MNYCYCGIDPGFSGGISIVFEDKNTLPLVYKMPVEVQVVKNKGKVKKKQYYDLIEIRKIFKENLDKNSVIVIEKVAPHQGEGSISSFNFGRGYGDIEGIIVGLLGKKPIEVSPQRWKKDFLELESDSILSIRRTIKELRSFGKTLEDKEEKIQNKKQIDKLAKQIKEKAKSMAREIVSNNYPSMKDLFKFKNRDGMAESLLIALYGRNHVSELV